MIANKARQEKELNTDFLHKTIEEEKKLKNQLQAVRDE